jgi:excisionase family DNA binding protein
MTVKTKNNRGVPCATFTIAEAAAYTGLSLGGTKNAIKRGEIPSVRIGKRVFVPRDALARVLQVEPAEQSPP